jgi:hypothetical protein
MDVNTGSNCVGRALAVIIVCLFSSLLLCGVSSAIPVNTSVVPLMKGKITDIDHPYFIHLYQTLPASVGFKNMGSVPFDARISFTIVNESGHALANFTGGIYNYTPSQERTYYGNYIPVVSGYQWVYATVDYNLGRLEAWSSFYVWPRTTPVVIPPPTPGGDGVVQPSAPEYGLPSMRINYTERIDVAKGQTYLLYIKVENLGTRTGNMTLTNIIFYAKSMGIPFTVLPEKISTLVTNDTGFFLVTLNVPSSIDEGEYSLDFAVISDETLKSGTVNITVTELSELDEVWDSIQNYLFIIERLKTEIGEAAAGGANVTKAQRNLDLATSAVDDSIGFYNNDDYGAARSALGTARGYLEQCVLEIALAKADLLRFVLPAYVTIILIILIIIAATTALFFFYTRRKKKEREKKQKSRAR